MESEFDAEETYTNNAEAAQELQALITKYVRKVPFPSGLSVNKAHIITAINERIDAKFFNKHNRDDAIVLVEATFTAQRADDDVFTLLIKWGKKTSSVSYHLVL